MSKRSTLKEECAIFVEETTLHGLKTVGDTKARVHRRVSWLLIMLCMLGSLIYYLVKGLTTYLSYPTTTKITLLENSSLVFPAVTICNNNLINKTYLTSNPVVGNFTLAYSPQYSSSPSMNLSNPEVEQQMKNISYVDIFIDGGHQLQETVLSCSWNKNVHLCNETFTPVNSDTYGYCYTFNAKGSTISEKPGNLYGLELVIYVGQEWYGHYARSDAAGIKVLIHEPSSYPSFQTNSLSVQTGVASEMIISRKQDIFLPHPYDGPDCYEGDDYTSLTECKVQCNLKYFEDKCQCALSGSTDDGMRECSLYDFHHCIVRESSKTWLNKNVEESCGCLHHCSEVSYEVDVTQMTYPSDYAASVFNYYTNQNHSAHFYGTDMIDLRIYYGNFITMVTEQVSSYSFANFSAEIGGYLGLFLGASLLTLTEVLELLFIVLTSPCKRKFIKNEVWSKK